MVFISRRYSYGSPEFKKVFDNPESATSYANYLGKGLEKQSPYKIEVKEVNLEEEWKNDKNFY
jgi:hypothetical protein